MLQSLSVTNNLFAWPALIALHVSVKNVSSPETPKLPQVMRKLLAGYKF